MVRRFFWVSIIAILTRSNFTKRDYVRSENRWRSRAETPDGVVGLENAKRRRVQKRNLRTAHEMSLEDTGRAAILLQPTL